MNEKFQKLGFYPADILLPKDADMTKWAVVACDQFTSQPEYWQAVEDTVGDAPSTLRLILPEAKLNDPDVDKDIADINSAMKVAAAHAIADLVSDEERNEDYIIPGAFDARVAQAVADAVARAARESGVARL